jgi:hypothetical protein
MAQCHVNQWFGMSSKGKRRDAGFDHGAGHSLLLLFDAKAPNYQNSKKFKGLGHYPSNTALSGF